MKSALTKLEDLWNLIYKSQVNFKKCPKSRLTKGYLEMRLQTIKEYWSAYVEGYYELAKCVPSEKRSELPYFTEDHYCACEDVYLSLQGDIMDMLAAKTTTTSSIQQSSSSEVVTYHPHVKLPVINLPSFSGNYEDWLTFHDMFSSMVHNNTSISKVDKMNYLKASLHGDAESTIKHIQISECNYDQAWKALIDRYCNKRLIVKSVLKRLFTQKKVNIQTAKQVRSLLDTTTECLNSLQSLQISTDSWDPLIVFLVVQKLDPESHEKWEEYADKENSEDLPTWLELKKFLESKFRTLELTSSASTSTTTPKSIKERSFHVTASTKSCAMCNEDHTLSHCKQFIKMEPKERGDFVKGNNICFNCLGPNHSVKFCRLPFKCRICNKRHHTLLHQKSITSEVQTKAHHSKIEDEDEENNANEETISSYFVTTASTTLLATALVNVIVNNQMVVLRALVDSGSEATFISERAAQLLRAKREPVKGTVTGVGGTTMKINHTTNIEIKPRDNLTSNIKVKAYIVPTNLTKVLPSKTIKFCSWPHISKIHLADPNFNQPGRIDLLLGVEIWSQIIKSEIIKGPPGTPSAQNTSLGWILFGKINDKNQSDDHIVLHHHLDLDNMLKAMWEVESTSKGVHTPDERLCESIYQNNYARNQEGRYIVKLPFKHEDPISNIGETRDIAKRRFYQLERRLEKNQKLKKDYTAVIEEYQKLNFLEEVPEHETDTPSVYLPHHAVIKEEKDTTKVRVVFDASTKGTKNISLNNELLVGPQLQEDMRELIIRWRTHKICYVADIKQMYLQVMVQKTDADYQRILWRNNPTDPLKDYRLLRVTFGTASAPYLAVKTLQQVAEDEGKAHQAAVISIREDFFMDDYMSGKDTVHEAITTAKEVHHILKKGGFTLHKWASNNTDFLQEFSPSERSTHVAIDLKLDGTVRALGLAWNMGDDTFQYQIKLPNITNTITKRTILSDVQKLFDPLGWLSPAIVPAKILIQQLWLKKITWDEEVDHETVEIWRSMRESFQDINLIKLPRWLYTEKRACDITVHGYCDASNKAYAAVAYARVVCEDGEVKTNLIAARSRVAPVKSLSIPRLELCGALLLSRLLKQIKEAIRLPAYKIYAWTDSTIVLSWLSGDPTRWNVFVRNRVVEITDNIGSQWYHVASSENPADVASRGLSVSELRKCDIWWDGPKWLKESNINTAKPNVENTKEEIRSLISNLAIEEEKDNSILAIMETFRDLRELVKTIATARRFIRYKIDKNKNEAISTEELDTALMTCIKLAQNKAFPEDVSRMQSNKALKRDSKLRTLSPFLDESNIIRVGGRLRHSNLDDKKKHPIILDSKNELTALIVADAHRQTLHGGVQLMLANLRSRYWIIRAKNIVKKQIHRCLICARHNAVVRKQLMGDLPKARVTPARPFLHSGVDFAGPYDILQSKGRGAKVNKAYIAIFICMATKAIHIELVGDLTSEAYIAAFKRFVSRRGKCTHLWSDQGRNFVGANKELKEAWKQAKFEFNQEHVDEFAAEGTQWHFIPAYSPNFGGLWEAGVKSIKTHLKKILTTNLTFDEMYTVLCQIEACLNSRPLSPVNEDDVNDLQVLTPGHFLIGEAPINVPSPSLKNQKISNLSRWQHTQKLVNDFWRKWQEEYLSRLQQRPKWMKKQEEFKIGDVVLIKTENLPPGKWSMGRVVDKHPGNDNVTRVYSVKSGSGITKRCISKLCPLPINVEND